MVDDEMIYDSDYGDVNSQEDNIGDGHEDSNGYNDLDKGILTHQNTIVISHKVITKESLLAIQSEDLKKSVEFL